MTKTPTDTLAARLQRLERQSRRLKWGAVAFAVVLGAGLLMGQARPNKVAKTIEAERFVLRDRRGQKRAELLTWRGSPTLNFLDTNGAIQVSVGLAQSRRPGLEQASLRLYSADGKNAQAVLGISHGRPSFRIFSKEGNGRVELTMLNGEPTIELRDKNGKLRAVLGCVSFKLPRGTVVNRPPSSLILFNEEGKVIFGAP